MNCFPWYAAEMFLRVCEAGGLTAAARFGKTGISQPALSAQMMVLERHLGVKLFVRKPFRLTEEGSRFREEAERLQARMVGLRDSLSASSAKPLRIAASDVIIREYLPGLFKQMDTVTRRRLILHEAPSQDLAGMVRDGVVDLGIGLLSRHAKNGSLPLVEILARLPLVLLVPPGHRESVKQWIDLMKLLRKGEQPSLVALPHNNLIMQHIQTALRKAGVEWHPGLEVSSLSSLATYVGLDFGFGFGVKTSKVLKQDVDVAVVNIPEQRVPPLHLGIWHGENLDPFASHLITLVRRFAKENLRG